MNKLEIGSALIVVCVIAAASVSISGRPGWGWFLAVAALLVIGTY